MMPRLRGDCGECLIKPSLHFLLLILSLFLDVFVIHVSSPGFVAFQKKWLLTLLKPPKWKHYGLIDE